MTLICTKCGELLLDGKEHATEADCLASLKELVRRIRKALSHAAYDVATCRAHKHGGRKVLYPVNLCMTCLGMGYAGYQVGHEIATTGLVPQAAKP